MDLRDDQSVMRLLSIRILRILAFDIPIYREVFSRFGGILAGFLGYKQSYLVEGRLRGLTYHQIKNTRPRFVGRGVVLVNRKNITLGNDSILWGWNFLFAGIEGFIRIGVNTHIDVYSVLYGHGGLSIGNHCAIASGVIIYTQSNQYASHPNERIFDQPIYYAPVIIGDNVWIGAQVTILPGVNIGDGAVVGAASLVREDVPPGTIVVGVPAHPINRKV